MNLIPRDALFDLDKLFDGFYQPTSVSRINSNVFNPRVDIFEAGENYELVAELPGISKEQISVTVEDSTLTIEASTDISNDSENSNGNGKKILRKERRSGKFVRSFNLGQDIEQGEIQASFKDGLLILTVPKAKEAVIKSRQIEIH